eukprot:gene16498-biopygen25438
MAAVQKPSGRAPSGGLVTGPSIPNVVGAYWASVSSVPPSAYPDAQEEVMAAHRQASSSLPPSVADEVGSLTEEVMAAHRQASSSLPPSVADEVGSLTTLSLARHGAAVSSAETARRDWLHAQERPCPLLTKLERPPPASRLVPSLRAPSGGLVTGPSIPNVVGAYWASVSSVPPSAYPDAQEEVMAAHRQASSSLPPSVADEVGSLTVRPGECRIAIRRSPPGKSPGPDGIPIELFRTFADCFTPLLCRLYSAMGRKGLLPPEFLEGSLIILGKGEVAGLGGGFLTWVRLLLSSTATRAMVNGFRSRAFEFLAGVRQGDPLSPLLFLFAMQALQHWLLHKNIGMDIKPGSPCTGCKYADDTIVLLRSLDPAQLQAFLTCLTFFGQAPGLYLNHLKSKLLPIGVPHPLPLPVQILGFPVVAEATTLGVSFTNGSPTCPPMTPQWSERLAHVERCFSRLAKLPLSSFGWGFSSSSYGLSTLLYHAEFCGIPQEVVDDLQCLTTKLVDRGLGPADKARVLPGVPSALLTGSPCQGGLGVMPWQHHITSRHAMWGVRLFRGAALNAPPCVSYGTFLDDVFYRLMQIPSLVCVADAYGQTLLLTPDGVPLSASPSVC